MADSLAIGVDLGATKIATALVSAQGQIVTTRQVATEPAEGEQAVLERIAAEVNVLTLQAPGAVLGVGIGSPGLVNSEQGIVQKAVNLGWDKVHLAREIRSRLATDLPVWIAKDANASALGEYTFGAAQGCRDFVYLGVGSGLGAGVMANGRLVTGVDWMAADVGHLSLDPNGRDCACGQRGCAETVVSGPGLIAVTRQRLAERAFSTRLDSPSLTVRAILAAARDGDELALAAIADVARGFGIVMAACVVVLNPAVIVVGGGLGLAASDLLLPGAESELCRRASPTSRRQLQVVLSWLTSSAVGAACLVWSARDGTL